MIIVIGLMMRYFLLLLQIIGFVSLILCVAFLIIYIGELRENKKKS